MRFVDETGIASGHVEESPVDAFQDDWPDTHSEGSGTFNTAATIMTDASTALPVQAYPTPPEVSAGIVRPHSPTDRFLQHDDHVVSPIRCLPSFHDLAVADPIPTSLHLVLPFEFPTEDPEVRAMRAKIYRDVDAWPLESREEAMLFRHYIQKLSIWVSPDPRPPRLPPPPLSR